LWGGEGREVFVAKWGEGEVKGTSLTKRNTELKSSSFKNIVYKKRGRENLAQFTS